MRIYLDNCCYNRPFDNWEQQDVYDEAQAVLEIQARIIKGRYELVWSFILDLEAIESPFFEERREDVFLWREKACSIVVLTDQVLSISERLRSVRSLKIYDSLHVSCAIAAGCDFFVTTDRRLINNFGRVPSREIEVTNVVDFLKRTGAD